MLAMLSFPSNKENGGFAKYPAHRASRIFQTRKASGPMSNLDRNFEAELKKLRELQQSGVPILIFRPRKGNIGLSDTDVTKMDEAFKIVKSAADAFIEHFASSPGAQKKLGIPRLDHDNALRFVVFNAARPVRRRAWREDG